MLTSHIRTVYERSKQNGGFVAGPNHRMLNAGLRAEPEAEQVPAPNYQEGEPGHQCMECEYYQDDRTCTKHNFKTKPQMVCDDFEAAGEGEGSDQTTEPNEEETSE